MIIVKPGIMNIDLPKKVIRYDFGEFRLDVEKRQLFKDNEPIFLTNKSFETLLFLIEHRGKKIKKNLFFEKLWSETFVEETNLAQRIYIIRKILNDNKDQENYIETISKYGYRFNASVTEIRVGQLSKESNRTPNKKVPPDNANNSIVKKAPYQEDIVSNYSQFQILKSPEYLKGQEQIYFNINSVLNKRTILTLLFGVILTLILLQAYSYFI